MGSDNMKTYTIRQADTLFSDIYFMAEKVYKPVKNTYATLIEKPFFALTVGECEANKFAKDPPSILPIKETIAYETDPKRSWRLVHDTKAVIALFESEGITSCKWNLLEFETEKECLEEIEKLKLEYDPDKFKP